MTRTMAIFTASCRRRSLALITSLLTVCSLMSTATAFLAPSTRTTTSTPRHDRQITASIPSFHYYTTKQRQHSTSINFWSRSDPPLSSLVDVSANYTLAACPESHLHLHEGQRLVCLGDVHGDVDALKESLHIAGVYDSHTDAWCGGNTILVQCGDVLDRGTQELQCFSLLARLSQQALEQQGRVVLLLGNHEAMNAMGLFQYALGDEEYEHSIGVQVDEQLGTPSWRRQYVGNQPARWASYEPGGLLAASLLANMKVAIKVGRTVLVHAGLRPEHVEKYGGLEGMNQAFQDWIRLTTTSGWGGDNPVVYNNNGQYASQNMATQDAERRQNYYINSIPEFLASATGANGPIWMRDYSSPSDLPPRNPHAQQMIDQTLHLLNADRMVMGHTIQRHINCALDGKAWRVDVGASRGCLAGNPEVLEIARTCVENPYYGASCEERISVLTRHGRVPGEDRQVTAMVNYL